MTVTRIYVENRLEVRLTDTKEEYKEMDKEGKDLYGGKEGEV